jgi:hypothetical protein
MRGGNLSGLAMCGSELWAVSDRDDDQIYRLDTADQVWQAEALHIDVPPVPDTGLPWGLRSRNWAASFVRGGDLDFEGITCDSAGNRYIVSEGHAAVLQVPVSGPVLAENFADDGSRSAGQWHAAAFQCDVRRPGDQPGGRPDVAGRRAQSRGLLLIKRQQTVWDCDGRCVLFSEAGKEMQPPQFPHAKAVDRDFSDLSLFNGKLFTLERNAFRFVGVMRRRPRSSAAGRTLLNCCRPTAVIRRTSAWKKR